jgi:Calcineurin-like phosphoesterase
MRGAARFPQPRCGDAPRKPFAISTREADMTTRTRPSTPAFRPAATRPRPKRGVSQAHPGVQPLDAVAHRNTSFQQLPRPLGLAPYHYDLAEHFPDIAHDITADKKMVFHVIGDSGGVKDGEFQGNVAAKLIEQREATGADRPQFCYHVGDVVYFTGEKSEYYAQFYEPYAHYDAPIFSIPGNHDGEVDDPSAQTSLDGWVQYFMQAHPDVDPISKDAPRVQLNQPNVYWTLTTPFATIIGMYTNVPEHGSIDSTQQQWLTNEFATAPEDKALILALHHPIYSFDVYHSGSSKMADALENAIRDTGRVPNLVLSGHVHDYQRVEQDIVDGTPTPFIVVGNGGYHNLHQVHSQPGDKASDTDAVLKYAAVTYGFLTLTIDADTISGVSTEVDRDDKVSVGDKFSYTAKPLKLADPKSVPTL